MNTNGLIDIALGLILMYLVLSLICTVVNEAIATAIGLRARTLRSGVTQLIDNPALLATFNDHGLISGVRAALGGKGPSYLSGRTFAAALVDSLDPDKPLLGFQEVKTAIDKLPTSNVKDWLSTAVVNSGDNIEALRTNVATWFDATMERLSGVYKRWLQIISFLVGAALAVGLNADSYVVAKAIWSDPSLRGQVADVSSRIVSAPGNDQEKLKALGSDLNKLREDLRPLPIGWDDSPGRLDHGWAASAGGWISKILGWLFTAFAIMLGAPFWFDLLGKFVQLRASGSKPKA